MSRMAVWAAIIFVCAMVAWLARGRQLTLLLDRFITVRKVSLPVNHLESGGGGFIIGTQPMTFGGTDNLRADLRLTTDSSNRVMLCAGPRAFILGPRTNPVDQSGRPEIIFTAEPADELSFKSSRSVLSWRSPYQFNIMGGTSPRWSRYVYYRLVWKKRTGAKLEMFWRYEQQYYSAKGWTEPLMMWNSQTGLLSVDILPESTGPEGAVVRYITRTKGWNRSDYQIEDRGASNDGQTERFAVVHLCDVCGTAPGGGQSVELLVDREKHEVIQELGGQ